MHFEPGFGGGLGGVTLTGALKYYKKVSKVRIFTRSMFIDRFQSRGEQLSKLLGIKESFNM